MARPVTVSTALSGKHRQDVSVGPHNLIGDEPPEVGGDDAGPSPFEYLHAALGTCTSITLKMYADRKQWPLKSVRVDVTGGQVGAEYVIERTIHVDGDLDATQRARLLEIAEKCPVHKTLVGTIEIKTGLVA
jgi:putative redox protein